MVNGTLSVMRHLKMLPGAPAPVENPVWIDHLADVAADQSGIFYPLVKRGAYISAGMKIGYVTDYVGKVLYEARAKEPGVLLYVRAVPTINKGEAIASIGVVGVAPK
jgi:predicted deacylase